MNFSITQAVEILSGIPQWITLMLVSVGSGFEYVFPPFPGDTTVIAAATIAAWDGIPIWMLIAGATLGSIVGAGIGWKIGEWFVRSGYLNKLKPQHRASVDKILAGFERYGAVCLAFNRFVPGLRSFFFIAAAMARIPLSKAIFWAAVSGFFWSTLIVLLGVALANNLERLDEVLRQLQFSAIIFALIGAAAVYAFWRWRKTRELSHVSE